MTDSLSPFHEELLEYIQRDVEKRKIEEGFDPAYDRSFKDFQSELEKALEPGSTDVPVPLPQLIDQYNYLIGARGAVHLELKLLDSFPERDFAELGLQKYCPRMYRGLPRLYYKENASLSRVKSHFAHLPSLKRVAVEKALFSLYSSYEPKDKKVVLFTWVISDGFGDWMCAVEIKKILERELPDVQIEQVALLPNRFQTAIGSGKNLIYYDQDCPPSSIPQEAWEVLKNADLVLQAPTFYPYTRELTDKIKRFEHLGEYGYMESSWFHPKSGHRSMGLHFLEMGILTRKVLGNGFASVQNKEVLEWLFGTDAPGPAEIERYGNEHHFYLAYLSSTEGGKVYLHALLKSLERDDKTIDLCTPDLKWFVEYIEKCKAEASPILKEVFGVRQIEVWQGGHVYVEKISDGGKTVRIFCSGALSHGDFQALLSASGEFAAVRGDQSFTEAVCANKTFFYDSGLHARYFIKDLAALAENRIAPHRGTLVVLRQMARTFLARLHPQESDWVDEVYFQQSETFDWFDSSQKIGMALQDPDTVAGFKKFNRILFEEFSCNEYLVHLVKRGLLHEDNPILSLMEEKQVEMFTSQRQPFKALILNLQESLKKESSCQK
ncbi:MAG: hypothetical protein JSS32_07805 [Verrucomicrobia bacterium]|nr:hypothetical protein [Verrucomicrobiota bacterium]